MKQTVTIEIEDTAVLHLLQNLASMSLVRFTTELNSENDYITACFNDVYNEMDSSLDNGLITAQAEAIGAEDW